MISEVENMVTKVTAGLRFDADANLTLQSYG